MNRYQVQWHEAAENQLMAMWIRSANKDAITGYVDQIDRILARDPLEQGESREANIRLAFFRPVCVRYLVDETLRIVLIQTIRWVGR